MELGSGMHVTEIVCLNIYVIRQAWSSSICGPVKGLQQEDEGQQQVSVLAHSVWELSLDIGTFGDDFG